MIYLMQARSSSTGKLVTWVFSGSAPDNSGSAFPGPGSPMDIASTLDVGAAVPMLSITSISPSSGSVGGGTSLTINGTRFLAGAIVYVLDPADPSGVVYATGVVVVSETQITCVMPAHSTTGAETVYVLNPDPDTQVAGSPSPYTYTNTAPTIEAIIRNAVRLDGARGFNLVGSGFIGVTQAFATLDGVRLMDEWALSHRDDSQSLTAALPKVSQSFTGDGSIISAAIFSIDKTGSPVGDIRAKVYAHSGTYGTDSLPTGTALATSDPFPAASLTGSFAPISFAFSGVNKILLEAGVYYCLVVEFTYVSGGGGAFVNVGADVSSPTHSGNFAYYYDPGAHPPGGWNTTAFDLCFQIWTVSTTAVPIPLEIVDIINNTTLAITGPPDPGLYDIAVISPAGSSTPVAPLSFVKLLVFSMTPTSGKPGVDVLFVGSHFDMVTDVHMAGTLTPVPFVSSSDGTSMHVTIPTQAAGYSDLHFVTPLGTFVLGFFLIVAAVVPSISYLSPATTDEGGGDTLDIFGADFFDASAVTVDGGAASFTYVDQGHIRMIAPAGVGAVNVTVTTPKGTSAAATLTYTASIPGDALLQEDGTPILQEDGDYIILE